MILDSTVVVGRAQIQKAGPKPRITVINLICRVLCVLMCAAATEVSALQIFRTSSTNFYVDFSSDMRCDYVSYTITNTDGVTYSNLWVTIASFTNTVISLGAGDAGQYAMGALANNRGKPAFFYLQATNLPATSQHTINVYNGYPTTGTLLASSNFVLSVQTSGANNANKVTSVTYSPTNNPVLGGVVKISVQGTTGNVAVGNDITFTAGTFTNWNAGAFELVACNIVITDTPPVVLTNTLDTTSTIHITGTGDPYQADYWVRAVAVTTSNTPVSPVSYLNNGGGTINHVQESALLALPPVIPTTNLTVMTSLVSSTQLYTNEVATFTLQFSNSSAVDVTIDRVVDTLPAGFSYVSNSCSFNGASILNPSASGQVFTWSQTYVVPAGTSRSFAFQATPTIGGYATNSAVAFVKNTQIDTTLIASDNAPAIETVRVLLAPTAANATGTTPENQSLSVAAPGVLTNDVDPNGFSLSVISYTQPGHGSVTVNADGSYVYSPATNYYGSDSFSYTMTNGNGRASSAAVNLSVLFVNHSPTLDPISPITVNEDAPQQTVNLTGISAGPTNESSQTLTVTAASSNPGLIPNPTVTYTSADSTGTLTLTPATNSYGQATLTVIVKDSGGTTNGGIDSVTNTLIVTVAAVTNIWAANGSLTNHVNNADGPPGTGYDSLHLIGVLDIQATSNNPFTIHLVSLADNISGPATNFNKDASLTWTLATAARAINGFATNKFAFDTSLFTNDLGGGVFSAALSADGLSVNVVFTPNHTPTASPIAYGRAHATFLRIPVSEVLTNASDPDGDPLVLAGLGSSTNGSYIATNGAYVIFAPTNNVSESFLYVVSDGRNYRPWETPRMATNLFTITVTNSLGLASSITATGTNVTVRFAGIPGYRYDVERTTDLASGPWIVLLTTNAPPAGVWIYVDNAPPSGGAFYRTEQY